MTQPDENGTAPETEPTPSDNRDIRSGWWSVLVGAAAVLFGIYLSMSSQQAAEEGGSYRVYYGLIAFGVISLGFGVIGLFRASQVRKGRVSETGEAAIDEGIRKLTLGKVLMWVAIAAVVLFGLLFVMTYLESI